MEAFLKSPEQLLDEMEVNEKEGLTGSTVERNRLKYGVNSFSKAKPISFFVRLITAMKEPMILLLIIATIIAFAVNVVRAVTGGHADFVECVGMIVAILLAVSITILMEGRSEKAFDALNKIKEGIVTKVLRNSEVILVPQAEIVVGDIVFLETGDKIPADGRLLETVNLSADESSLTGESNPVKKSAQFVGTDKKTPVAERTNMLYSGCFITGGSGKMLVTAVGDMTEFGKIAHELSEAEKGSTPLQERLGNLGKIITILGTSAAGFIFAVQLIIFIINGNLKADSVFEAFITSIVLIVAAVPEGLPTIVAVSLALNIIKMSKQNALVKKLIACETIGCVNVICSDKTGTLTQNKMTVVDIYSDGRLYKPAVLENKYLIDNFCINSTADISFSPTGMTFMGNPTECALLAAYEKTNPEVSYKQARENARIIHSYPFSSETKNMTTAVDTGSGILIFSKGSPEKIIERCDRIMSDGQVSKLSQETKEEIERKIEEFQKNAGRILAFAHKSANDEIDFENDRQTLESGMIYDGFVVISDPLRDDVYKAVMDCKKAGVDLKILTGDNIVTATAIANQLGILGDGHRAVEAREIEGLDDKQLKAALSEIRVIARSTPIIKMRVVNALKELSHVVAVTGDGINDAPAIKSADVGIAMGISGTEVSKEASDIVLLDDSFSTIVKAVSWGRVIYENFQRFIQFQLTVNFSSVATVLVSILAGFAEPFTALQLLWVNIIMDGPPALTLGLEPNRGHLMNREPTPRNDSIVTKDMLFNIFFNGAVIFLIFIAENKFNVLGAAPEQKSTVLFTLFVVLQLFNAFNCRELSGRSIFQNFFQNKIMMGVFAITFLLQVLITQMGGRVFNTVPLPIEMWGRIILASMLIIVLSEIVKLVRRAMGRNSSATI